MRIATMIISLILMLVVGAQSCAVSLGDAALETKAAEQSGPIGLFMAFLFLIGGLCARLPVRVRTRLLLCRHHRARWGSEHLLQRLDRLGRRVFDLGRPQLLRPEGEAQEPRKLGPRKNTNGEQIGNDNNKGHKEQDSRHRRALQARIPNSRTGAEALRGVANGKIGGPLNS